jgi:hypothetical protein
MNRSLSAIAFLAFVGASVVNPTSGGASDRSQPMHFALRLQGPEATCGSQCKLYIAASGAITADTPTQFQAFAKNRKLNGAVIVLDSDGGSVHGAIGFGREIRRLGLDTAVGRLTDLKTNGNKEPVRATLSPRADCESMCSFVLLAGVHRWVPSEARVMVHQIWLGDRRDDPIAANYSAEDLVLVQRDIGKLATYTAEMGASMDMLDLSLRIPPWEPMHVMTRDEIQRMHVATEMPDVPSAAAVASSPPKPVVQPDTPVRLTNGVEVADITERSWGVVDHSGVTTLARRYPLTLKGEEIGGFDLLVSCSGSKGGYDALYIEHRHEGDELALPKVVQSVSLRAAGQEAALKVVSSEQRDDELVTLATGKIPASLVDGFGADGKHSMLVETQAEKVRTAIRIGNTGVAQSLPRLAGACSAVAPQQRADASAVTADAGK